MASWRCVTWTLLHVMVVLLVLPLDTCRAIKWENCAPASAPVTIETVTMSPDPAISGGNFTIALPAVTNARLEGGNVGVYVTYYGIPVHISNEDLCTRTQCPVEVGDFTFLNTEFLPFVTPSGSYKLWLSATGTDGSTTLFCTKVSFQIVRPKATAGRKAIL